MHENDPADPDLRATRLAAERAPAEMRERHARLSALLGEGALILPYVLAASCSDPLDRRVPDGFVAYTRVEGTSRGRRHRRKRDRHETAPRGNRRLLVAAVIITVLWIVMYFVQFFWTR